MATNNYIVHPAFIKNELIGGWDRELPGIWVAKNEMGSSYDMQGGTQFAAARKIKLGMTEEQRTTVDTHMAKMTEWGAAAYLSTSKYGSGDSQSETTTGNEYGIKGMAGGAVEYTSAYLSSIAPGRVSNIYEIKTAPAKYKTVYEEGGIIPAQTQIANKKYYGDAFNETKGWDGAGYADPSNYFAKWGYHHGYPRPLFTRGKTSKATTGGKDTVYTTSIQCSNTNFAYSYRLILIPKDLTVPEIEVKDTTTTEATLTGRLMGSKNGITKYELYVDGKLYQTVDTKDNSTEFKLTFTKDSHECCIRVYNETGNYVESSSIYVHKHIHTDECYTFTKCRKR